MCKYIDILRSDDVGLQGKPMALNSGFRSSMTDSCLPSVQTSDRWDVPICVKLRRRWCLHTLREAREDVAANWYEGRVMRAIVPGASGEFATTWNICVKVQPYRFILIFLSPMFYWLSHSLEKPK